MYKPAPPRAKKTNIVRSRNGCEGCRLRRRKCDEAKPRCGRCAKLDIACEATSQPLGFRMVTFDSPRIVDTIKEGENRSSDASETVRECESLASEKESHAKRKRELSPRRLCTISSRNRRSTRKDSEAPCEARASAAPKISPMRQQVENQMLVIDGVTKEEYAVMQKSNATPATSVRRESNSDTTTALVQRLLSPRELDWLNRSPHEKEQLKLYRSPAIAWGSAHQESFYMNIWDKQCLSALHPAFQKFGILDHNPPIVQEAILSLAACYMSRMHPQRKALTASDIPGLAYRPDFEHQVASQNYYQAATQKMRTWAGSREMTQLNSMLAAMILFCSLESSMGNFTGFNIHFNGVNRLLRMRDQPDGPHDTLQLELQDAWRQTHILNWWRRFHFSTPEFQNTPFPKLEEVNEPRDRDALFWPIYHRVDIMTTLCGSLSILARATIRAWNTPGKLAISEVADLEQELIDLNARSLEWILVKQSSHIGFSGRNAELDRRYEQTIDNLPPFKFATHEAAMDFAYRTAERVFACSTEKLINEMTGVRRYERTQNAVEGYIWLLLRVAVAINWEDCVRYNTHTIGMSGLLLACAIRSEKLEVGLWIEDWLEERRKTAGLEEGSFPVLQILQILRIVNRERKRGLNICALFNTTDDGGGAGKFQSYHSQVIDTVMVYATCRETGQRVRKEIPV